MMTSSKCEMYYLHKKNHLEKQQHISLELELKNFYPPLNNVSPDKKLQ